MAAFALAVVALLCVLGSALEPCCNPDGTCSFLPACTAPCGADGCRWSLMPFQDAMPLPGMIDGQAHVVLEAKAFSGKLHAQLPAIILYGFASQSPGPTIVVRPRAVLQLDLINSLPKHHALAVDRRVHGVMSDEPLLTFHLHGANVRARYDGQPGRFLAPQDDRLSRDSRFFDNVETGTQFYHDHSHGITRLNVAMGLYGMYIVSEKPIDASRDVPLLITALSFNNTGIWYRPTPVHFYRADYFLCNGKIQPYFNVQRAEYVFRIVNLAQSNVLHLSLSPRHLISFRGKAKETITMSMGENFDVKIDFSEVEGSELILNNGDKPLLKFVISGARRRSDSAAHEDVGKKSEKGEKRASLSDGELSQLVQRTFLMGLSAPRNGSNLMRWWSINGLTFDNLTEFVTTGTREIWTFVNTAGMDHPMHIHSADFTVLSRQNGNESVPLRDEDAGSKNTVGIGAHESATLLVDFTSAHLGRFPYHCHDLTHEDYSMMRQYLVVNQPGKCNENGICECGEDCVTCPKDCILMKGSRCGNGVCEEGDGESPLNCKTDCSGPLVRHRSMPALPACQGDLICEGQENAANTPLDCTPRRGPVCGDCYCDAGEEDGKCALDCFRKPIVAPSAIAFEYAISTRPVQRPLAVMPLVLITSVGAGVCVVVLIALFFFIQRRQ